MAKVYFGEQFFNGKRVRGWRSCTVVRRYEHPALGERVDVRLSERMGCTLVTCCDARYVREPDYQRAQR